MSKPVYILGINGSSRASAVLLKDGKIIAAALEERFSRIKIQAGYPRQAINYCLDEAKIKSTDLDSVWIGFLTPTLFLKEKYYGKDHTLNLLSKIKPYFTRSAMFLASKSVLCYRLYELRKHTPFWKLLSIKQKSFVGNQLNLSKDKINMLDHHTSHGFAAYYTNPNLSKVTNKKVLVITMDGSGDKVCSRIFIVQNQSWREIASTSNDFTLGWLYEYVTEYLNMKPNEDEYKVMGLAPYANTKSAESVYQIFKKLMWVEGLSVKSSIPRILYPEFLKKNLDSFRFDAVAGGIQKLTENVTAELVQNAIRKTGINNIVLGGGVFMNVKANMKIAQLKEVKTFWVCPSSTDDSTAIGASYFGYKKYCNTRKLTFNPQPAQSLYLGPSYTDKQIRPLLLSAKNHGPIRIKKLKNTAKEVAKLLAKGGIVARFASRMEYGARALGNRSILANPADSAVIKIINSQIKSRDFWMPFASTILQERENDYIINSKKIDSPYMTIAFSTTKKGGQDLKAAMHPYDETVRAQILGFNQNPDFWKIIKEFEKLTGVGALLNTSFNLHGEPIVCSPEDALATFLKSGLQYLALEDYLVIKDR